MSDEENELITAEDAVNNIEQEDEITQEIETEQEAEQEQESDPEIIERAKKYGHLSKEEWIAQGRRPEDWKTPEEFDKTGKVIEQIYSLKKQVEQRDRELKAVIAQQDRIAQREYDRAKKDLESRLAAAEEDMDVKSVSHYTRELVRLEDMEQQTQQQKYQQEQEQAKQNFLERNQHWFNERNPDLQQRAIEIDNEIKADINAGRIKVNSYDDIGVMIEKRLAYEHPERILGPKKVIRPNVSSPVNKTAVNANSAKRTFQSLSQDLKDTYNAHKRIRASMGQELTEAEFIERLKADGEI